jgi:hypothetical protein
MLMLMLMCRASDKTGLDEFKDAIRRERRDALFLGGGLREGWLFDEFRKKVIDAAKVSLSQL